MQYNICDYGATSDGKLCTKEIQAAIDACFLSGGGEVVIPSGTFVTGGIRIRSNVTLHLMENAVLQGSINPEDYTSYINDKIEPIPMAERDVPVNTVKQGAHKDRGPKTGDGSLKDRGQRQRTVLCLLFKTLAISPPSPCLFRSNGSTV